MTTSDRRDGFELWLDASPRRFWVTVLALTLAVTACRYRDPFMLFPYADDWWHYLHTNNTFVLHNIFGTLGARPLWYFLLWLLQPWGAVKPLLPEAFPFFGAVDTPEMQLMIFQIALPSLAIVPAAAWSGWKVTGSRLAGLVVAVLMTLSPYQNLIAPTLEPQALQLIPVALLSWRLWGCDLARGALPGWRDGVISGLCAASLVGMNYHGWFLLVPAFPLVGLELAWRAGTILPAGRFQWKRAVGTLLPYAAGVTAALFGPLVVIDAIFWLNGLLGHRLFFVFSDSASYFSAVFLLRDQMGGTRAWMLADFLSQLHGFISVVRQQVGGWGAVVLMASLAWALVRPHLAACWGTRSLPVSLPLTVMAGFLFICQPTVAGFGRLTMPMEVGAYILVAQLVIDSLRLQFGRWPVWPLVGAPVAVMCAHMAFTSGVIMHDQHGFGRASRWLIDNPRPTYYASGAWAAQPLLTPAEAAALPMADGPAYLLVVQQTAAEWMPLLKEMRPIHEFRHIGSAWKSFHFINVPPDRFEYYWDRVAVYDMGEVKRVLMTRGASKTVAR